MWWRRHRHSGLANAIDAAEMHLELNWLTKPSGHSDKDDVGVMPTYGQVRHDTIFLWDTQIRDDTTRSIAPAP